MKYKRIFALTGAGVSAESGLDTFRDKAGLWTEVRIEDVATIQAYERDPGRVLEFYNMRRGKHRDVAPNPAHLALGQLQRDMAARGGRLTLCTQNVDNLHELGGASDVIHMHGEITKSRCHGCADVRLNDGELLLDLGCAACGRIGTLRPHVVWFGETPLEMDRIYAEMVEAELFVAIGTSGAVYPAAGFVGAARQAGMDTLELNLAPSDNAFMFDEGRYGPASEVTPAWVLEVLAG